MKVRIKVNFNTENWNDILKMGYSEGYLYYLTEPSKVMEMMEIFYGLPGVKDLEVFYEEE